MKRGYRFSPAPAVIVGMLPIACLAAAISIIPVASGGGLFAAMMIGCVSILLFVAVATAGDSKSVVARVVVLIGMAFPLLFTLMVFLGTFEGGTWQFLLAHYAFGIAGVALLLNGAWLIASYFSVKLRLHVPGPEYCSRCLYDLRHLPVETHRCPECGGTLPAAEGQTDHHRRSVESGAEALEA